jgi:tRNA pseudouridine38-40 synthase
MRAMPRYKLTVEYAGTRYSGWQVQKNAKTVAGEIERAVAEAAGRAAAELYGSGRTDAGVHALGQVAHLDLASSWTGRELAFRVNEHLPHDIVIVGAERVPHRFHARHSAISRSYLYQVARRKTAFGKPLVWWVRDDLDVAAMQKTAAAFAGFHDFRAFADNDPEEVSTRVALDGITVEAAGALVLMRVEGSHFLWRMVRRLVGVLVEVGRGGLSRNEAAGLLDGDSDLPPRLTAPPSGLFLEHVRYPGDPGPPPLRPVLRL